MKDGLYEQLSALVDDELTGSEHLLLLKRIEGDEELYQRLARYQLISDAMQNHLPDRIDPVFSRRIKERLRAEPAWSRYRRLGVLGKPLAGLTLAASVAVMAVLTIQSARQESASPVEGIAGVPPPAGYLQVRDEPGAMVRPPVDQKLDIYLVNHNEYAANRGMQGMLPYVRIVGHEMTHSAKE